MAKKKNQTIPLPSDVGHDFEDDHDILTFRPTIAFVSPEKQPSIPGSDHFVEDDLAAEKQNITDLVSRYDAVAELVDMAEARIDDRVESLGGLDIQLDPVVDGPIIAAMKRMFPDDNPQKITYAQYKHALKSVSKASKPPPKFGPLDIRNAQENPLKTDFGALSLPPGMARPEIQAGSKVIEPISIPEFIQAAILALFGLLISLITDLIKSVVGIP